MRNGPPRGTLGTIHNARILLELLIEGPARTHQLTDLAARSGLSLPTVHRLLRSLVTAGFVEQDPQTARYGLGPEFLRLGDYYVSRLPSLRAAMPFLVELRNQTQGTVAVAVLVDTDAVYLDRIDGNDVGGVYRDGRRVHQALSCAAGRVLAANAPDDVWKKVIANHDDRWSSEDRDGWCQADYVLVEDVEATGHVEIAAPVRDSDGDVRAAVTVTGNPAVFTPEHLETHVARHLLRTVKAIPWGAGRG